jgi:glucokinase
MASVVDKYVCSHQNATVSETNYSGIGLRESPMNERLVPGGPWVVFDIGGTSLRAARFHPETETLSASVRRTSPSHWTLPGRAARHIQARLFGAIQESVTAIAAGAPPAVLAVAFPSPIDADGNALSAPTLWGDGHPLPFPVRRELLRLWPTSRVIVVNDVTAAGYRYLRDPAEDFCIVTVSSGIGSKVFVGGRAVVGAAGRGGEIGHWRVDFSPAAPRCDCGGQGHLGAVASGRGALQTALRLARQGDPGFSGSLLGRRLQGDLTGLDNEALADAFRRGDAWTVELIRRVAQPLGQALAAVHVALGIERFVIVGGFALALGEGYRRQLVQAAQDSCWPLGQDWETMLVLGEAEDTAGLIGAGRYALRCLQEF